MSERMPAWFLAHGEPLHLLGEQPLRRFWQRLSDSVATRKRPNG